MLKRAWAIAHPLLTLAAVGCCVYLLVRPTAPVPSGRASEGADHTFRSFAGVRWIGGDYELPAGERFAVVSLLEFRDGQYEKNYYRRVWDASTEGRVVRPMLMWGKTADGLRADWIDYAVTRYPGNFADLGGPLKRVFGSAGCEVVEGFRVIGFASSEECRVGHEAERDIGGSKCAEVIASRKRVLVIGVKPTADESSAEQIVRQLESR